MASILVVDDEIGLRDFFADALTDDGHRVTRASCAAEAVEHLEDCPFDLLLVDLRMPGELSGLDVLRRARAEWPEMQVIVLTAFGTVETAVEAMRLGAFDFLQKPVSGPAELRRLVVRALNWRGTRQGTRPLPAAAAAAASAAPLTVQSPLQRFLWELKRRHVYNVSAAYAAVAFILLQAAELVLPVLPVAESFYSVLVGVVVAGFPVAVALGWLYDITASGLRRSGAPAPGDVGRAAVTAQASRRRVPPVRRRTAPGRAAPAR